MNFPADRDTSSFSEEKLQISESHQQQVLSPPFTLDASQTFAPAGGLNLPTVNSLGVNNLMDNAIVNLGSTTASEPTEINPKITRSQSGALKRTSPYPQSNNPAKRTAEKINTVMYDNEGKPRNVVLIPTHNEYEILTNRDQEVKMNVEPPAPKKTRIPPITVFNQSAETVKKSLADSQISDYAIKHLRHGLHVYCNNTVDFKKVRQLLVDNKHQFYSHELAEEKQYKVVLRGLHRMTEAQLTEELKPLKLTPTSIRLINPRNIANRDDVLYVISFAKGSIKLNELKDHNVICHTRVTWEPYRHRGGLVQCARCQRPGHGVKYCNMPPRCGFCSGSHESKDCSPTKLAVAAASTSSETSSEANGAKSQANIEVKTSAKCCNCNAVGHFATDSNCPKRIQYIKSRQQRNRNVIRRQDYIQPQVNVPSIQVRRTGGPTYAQVVSEPGLFFGPSGTNRPSDFINHSGYSNAVHNSRPSGNFINDPFTVEEITALTFEIISSLQNVQYMPRTEAMMTIINLAMKHLYKNDK